MTWSVAIFVYTIATFGLAWIMGHSPVTRRMREGLFTLAPILVDLVECPACFGTHIGFWGGLLSAGWVARLLDLRHTFSFAVACATTMALYTTGANYLLGRATGLIKE